MRSSFVLYLAVNMLLCAILCFGNALPRETVSGMLGRRAQGGGIVWRALAAFVDCFHWWEPGHCEHVARLEDEARRVLY